MASPAGPCLAVIDMQRVFAEPGSAWLAPHFGEIIQPVGKLVAAFQPNVVFTRFIAPAEPHGSWRDYYQAWPFALQPPDADIYQLVDEFAAWSGQTLDAVTFSKWGPELRGHVAANLHVGNTRQDLLGVLTVLVPFIGYPRTLNALAAVDEIAPASGKNSDMTSKTEAPDE